MVPEIRENSNSSSWDLWNWKPFVWTSFIPPKTSKNNPWICWSFCCIRFLFYCFLVETKICVVKVMLLIVECFTRNMYEYLWFGLYVCSMQLHHKWKTNPNWMNLHCFGISFFEQRKNVHPREEKAFAPPQKLYEGKTIQAVSHHLGLTRPDSVLPTQWQTQQGQDIYYWKTTLQMDR